jgi:poly-gamma-glutamate capsule biosynthesis protein CapA/YwtB (metallophosphatase superfamily)
LNMRVDRRREIRKRTAESLRFVAAGQSLIRSNLRGDASHEFREVEKILQSADIAFTNFEGTIRGSYGGWPTKSGQVHASDPAVLDALKDMGFNALSLSNNHAFDLGPGGILSTLEEVQKRGFLHAGIGNDRASASQPGYTDTKKGRIGLVSMDCSPQPDYFYAGPDRPGINRLRVREVLMLKEDDFAQLKAISERLEYEKRKAEYIRHGFRTTFKGIQEFYGIRFEQGIRTEECRALEEDDRDRNLAVIRDAARRADLVIVYVHQHYWELPWETIPAWFRDFARQCIDAGADVFVSHGVPLLQAVEIYKQHPIFYSLGNFIFHSEKKETYGNDSIWQSVIVSCEFSKQGDLIGAGFYPISLGGRKALLDHTLSRDVPCLAQGEHGKEILRHLAELSAPFGTKIQNKDGVGRLAV